MLTMILVRPQMGENIGAAARAMANFGLDRMRLVDPRDGWPNPKAGAMASGAGRILDDALVRPDVPEAIADLTHVYATTARPRGLTKRVMTPEAAMAEARDRIAAGERVGVLFGPERTGLENEELVPAQTVVTVPVNPDFPSLNLAQTVLLVAYEWRRAAGAEPEQLAIPRGGPATRDDVARLLDHAIALLDARGFFWPEGKRASMQEHLANLVQRVTLTEADVRTLYGILKTLTEKAEGHDPSAR